MFGWEMVAERRRDRSRLAVLPADHQAYVAVEIIRVPVADVERTIEDAQRNARIEERLRERVNV